MPHVHLADKRQLLVGHLRFYPPAFGNRPVDSRKNILNSPRSFRPLPEDIFFARTGIQLYRSHSGSFLSTVVLFFHQQVKLIHPPKNISVFFPVVFQRFQQPHHGNPTFMFNCVTHNISIPVRYLKNKSSRYFGNVHISLSTINSNLSI